MSNNDDVPDDPTVHELAHVVIGDGIKEDGYVLKYNRDDEGQFWFERRADGTTMRKRFTSVTNYGSRMYGLVEADEAGLVVAGLGDAAPSIERVLAYIGKYTTRQHD